MDSAQATTGGPTASRAIDWTPALDAKPMDKQVMAVGLRRLTKRAVAIDYATAHKT